MRKGVRKLYQVPIIPPNAGPAKVPIRLMPPNAAIALPLCKGDANSAICTKREMCQRALPKPETKRQNNTPEIEFTQKSARTEIVMQQTPRIITDLRPTFLKKIPAGRSPTNVPIPSAAIIRPIIPYDVAKDFANSGRIGMSIPLPKERIKVGR